LTHSGRLTHEVVTRQPWIRRRSGKVRQLQTDVLTTEPRRQQVQWERWRAKRKLVSGSKHRSRFCGYHPRKNFETLYEKSCDLVHFGRKMVCSAVYNAMRSLETPCPCVLTRNDPCDVAMSKTCFFLQTSGVHVKNKSKKGRSCATIQGMSRTAAAFL